MGIVGPIIAILFFHKEPYYIIGSNGSVGAILGSFYYLFPKQQIKFKFWFTSFIAGENLSFELSYLYYLIVWLIFHFVFGLVTKGVLEIFTTVFGLVLGYIITYLFVGGRSVHGEITQ